MADSQFVHKALVTVKVNGQSIMMYPVLDPAMTVAERAHGFHVIKNSLLAANLTPRQLLNALGQQTGQGAVVDGAIAGYIRHFHDHWRNFRHLTILSWHDSTGAIINNTTTIGDSSILLPMLNGLLANCRQQDVMFVRVQVSIDYSYAIRGVSPIRVDFYVELPQSSTAMVNGGGVAYTLVTYAGPADLRTLDTAQSAATILTVTYQANPGQIVAPVFGATSATLTQDRAMIDLETKILRVVLPAVCQDVFQGIAPNYTEQPEAALEHVKQIIVDTSGEKICRTVQDYYTQFMGALQAIIKDRTFPVNACEKFKNNIDPELLPFFKQSYPTHTDVVALDSSLQLAALRAMLQAAQKAEDNRKLIAKAAVTAVNAQSFTLTGTTAGANASQAEQTLTNYTKRALVCFGCGGPHVWSVRQEDKSYTVTCPNKDKDGVRSKAEAKVAEIRSKRKKKGDNGGSRKKQKTTTNAANAVFDSDHTSTAGGRVVFVVQSVAAVLTAGELRPPMPISIMSNLPHANFSLGPNYETPNCPDVRCAIDTCAGLNTGSFDYLMALAKRYPHCLYRLYTSKEYVPITLSGIVQNEDTAVTTSLDCTFQFYLPYKLRGTGEDCLLSIAAGKSVTVNVILGMPFILSMKMVLDFVDNVATCNAIDHKPFPIKYRRTSNAVPAVDASANVGTLVHETVLQLERYQTWRNAQAALSTPSTTGTVRFTGDTPPLRVLFSPPPSGVSPFATPPGVLRGQSNAAASSAASSPTVAMADPNDIALDFSENQTLLHHNVQRMEGFM